jgi:putative FmdB family regulatory protein
VAPIYEYRCECSHQFEILVRAQGTETRCPECDSERVTKLVSSGGFILKGGGWYADGYSKGGSDG